MKFDPLINYVPHLKDPEQLLFWNFNELIKTLITLAAPADRQLEIMASDNAAEEMLLDYESFYGLVSRKYHQARLLDVDKDEPLDQLRDMLNELDFDSINTDGLFDDPAWQEIRTTAAQALRRLGMDDLDLKLESTTRLEEKQGESGSTFQQLKRSIVKK